MTYDSCIKGLTPEKLMIASSYLQGLAVGCAIIASSDEKKQVDKATNKTNKEARR